MASTTNYGWTTPDDTALVKDGASAIRSLGSSVDSTVKSLNPETTLGDISFQSATANTKTRLGIGSTGQVLTVSGGVPTWAAPAGDITGVTAGTGLSGGGTSGDVTVSLSSPVAATLGGTAQTTYATGDLLFASAANTLSKRTIGATGDVLTVSGGVPTWAAPSVGANFTTLATATPTNGATTYSFSSISNQNTLVLRWVTNGNTGTLTRPVFTINGSDIASYTIYGQTWFIHTGTLANSSAGGWTSGLPYASTAWDTTNILVIEGCRTTGFKQLTYYGTGSASTSALITCYGQWIMETPAAAITAVGMNLSSGFLNANVRLYGSAS